MKFFDESRKHLVNRIPELVTGPRVTPVLFGLISLLTPLLLVAGAIPLVGWLLVLSGALQVFYSFRRASEFEQRSESSRGKLTLLAGLLILAVPAMVSSASLWIVSFLLVTRSAQIPLTEFRGRAQGRVKLWSVAQSLVGIGLAFLFILDRDLSARLVIAFGAA